jgi:hypothetical protein
MTPEQKADITRRARMDALALRSGGPVLCPYTSIADATEWRKQFDLAVAEAKK